MDPAIDCLESSAIDCMCEGAHSKTIRLASAAAFARCGRKGHMSIDEQRDPRVAVTMSEIATRAGVHISTVSRALSSPRASTASTKTLEIRRIASELGFQPNAVASALRLQRTHALGVLVPRLTDYVLARIYEGIDQSAFTAGFTTFVGNTADQPALRLQRLEEFLERRPDGIVLGDARLHDDAVVQELERRAIPYTLTSRRRPDSLSATTDDLLGGRLAGEHLVALGHREVGVVAGEAYASTGVDRTAGFCAALAEAGHPVSPARIIHSRFDTAGGRAAADELLSQHPGLTAIFAVNDTAAIGAMGAIRASGRETGVDVAVIGYNDIPLAAQLPVPLTSIASPMFEMGCRAAELLIESISGNPVKSIQLQPTLHVRQSTTGVHL